MYTECHRRISTTFRYNSSDGRNTSGDSGTVEAMMQYGLMVLSTMIRGSQSLVKIIERSSFELLFCFRFVFSSLIVYLSRFVEQKLARSYRFLDKIPAGVGQTLLG